MQRSAFSQLSLILYTLLGYHNLYILYFINFLLYFCPLFMCILIIAPIFYTLLRILKKGASGGIETVPAASILDVIIIVSGIGSYQSRARRFYAIGAKEGIMRSNFLTCQSIALFDMLVLEVVRKKRQVIAESGTEYNQQEDLLTRMIKANEAEGNMRLSDEELRNNMMAFILAGHDTTATALSTCLYHLAIHEDVQRRVRDEVLEKIGNEEISREKQQQLTYLTQVVKENMRICPPAFTVAIRQLLAEERFGRHLLPAGTLITADIYALHHNKHFWPDPDHFNPERFTPANEKSRPPFAWAGFGGGPRICLGKTMSLMEQRIVLAHLLRNFKIKIPKDTEHLPQPYLVESTIGLLAPKRMELLFAPLKKSERPL
ncbi:uncharacterized protein VTP21DRAFT_4410 [Calcarisporiella thermophila]|uniref:uncharacterized protein n=1 Tax=Calcarisporiella thermophila TaxID=911321 RepID=UPI0037436D54